jgi:Fe2+ or Zn2+ uptake regulation protein
MKPTLASTSAGLYPHAHLICMNCGHVLTFNLVALGLKEQFRPVPEQPD